jgi:hypothetical protein
LTIVIEDIKIILPRRDLTEEQETALRNIAKSCENVLNALDKTLGKYQELGSVRRFKESGQN